MTFFKRSSAIFATAGLLFASAPAFANPFVPTVDGVFISPTIPVIPETLTPTEPATASQSEDVGNSEVQGLGDHESWISQDVLAEDPRALCSDVGLGSDTYASTNQSSSSSSSRTRNSSANASSREGSGGVSVLGIVSAGGGGAGSSESRSRSDQQNRERQSSASSVETSTVVVGQNCDAFVEAAAARDMNYEDNLTERYSIRVNRRGQQVDNLLER